MNSITEGRIMNSFDFTVLLFCLSTHTHFLCPEASAADVHASVAELADLLANEAESAIVELRRHIREERATMAELKRYAKNYIGTLKRLAKDNSRRSNPSDSGPLDNPINAFLLVKHLARVWPHIQFLMEANLVNQAIKNIVAGREKMQFPDEEDLNGAVRALLRLQDTFQLQTVELVNGIMDGEKMGQRFGTEECFEIGRVALDDEDYFYALEWIGAALDCKPDPEQETEILPFYVLALNKQGNRERALAAAKRLAELDSAEGKRSDSWDWEQQRRLPPIRNARSFLSDPELAEYERLCRGEREFPNLLDASLHCYLKRDKPFLKLAPFKVELLHIAPLLAHFHDILSQQEVALLQQIAKPKLRRAMVQNVQTGKLELVQSKISKSTWLHDEEHPAIGRINIRISDMVNLEPANAQNLEVVNYGIGGHYEPHYDFAKEPNAKHPTDFALRGERIANMLIYMSRPKKGGHTVFPLLGVRVPPSSGDALFWYNLHRDGEGDYGTKHVTLFRCAQITGTAQASCPVLVGQKWTANKIFHERGQEFVRPCALGQNVDEHFVGDRRRF